MIAQQWSKVSRELRQELGESSFKSWIEPLELVGVENGVARLRAPSRFVGDWVKRNYHDKIVARLRADHADLSQLEFSVGGAPRRPKPDRKAAAQPAEGSTVLEGAPLEGRYTFDNFVVGKPNELAHAAAKRVAEGGPVTFNPLFLYGGVGLGKTHLMHAVAHELHQSRPDLQVLYLSAEQFMYRFVQALRDRQIMDFKNLFRSVDVLMVDDVQFIAGKDSTQEEFFHTFNALVDQNKQIVISADRAPGEIKDLEARITSRMQCGLVVDLHPTDYELRLGILHRKAAPLPKRWGR